MSDMQTSQEEPQLAQVQLKLVKLSKKWTDACELAAKDLNTIFLKNKINVTVSTKGTGPVITVMMDATLAVSVGAHTTSEWNTQPFDLVSAETRIRPVGEDVGPGIRETIVAHEFVHALGHTKGVGGMDHSTHLMTDIQTYSGDKLVAGSVKMPPLQLSDASIALLQKMWP